jgi:hypothetical protein
MSSKLIGMLDVNCLQRNRCVLYYCVMLSSKIWNIHVEKSEFFSALMNLKQIEGLGSEYFYDLLSRPFFNQSSMKKSQFAMHDLGDNLAQWVAKRYMINNNGS